jgi:hypothetical protein
VTPSAAGRGGGGGYSSSDGGCGGSSDGGQQQQQQQQQRQRPPGSGGAGGGASGGSSFKERQMRARQGRRALHDAISKVRGWSVNVNSRVASRWEHLIDVHARPRPRVSEVGAAGCQDCVNDVKGAPRCKLH